MGKKGKGTGSFGTWRTGRAAIHDVDGPPCLDWTEKSAAAFGSQESAATRRTPSAGVAAARATTSRRAPAAHADTLRPRTGTVSGAGRHAQMAAEIIEHVNDGISSQAHGDGRSRRQTHSHIYILRAVQWGQKAIGRKTTGTGRMRYLKDLPRRFKNGFQEGEQRWVAPLVHLASQRHRQRERQH